MDSDAIDFRVSSLFSAAVQAIGEGDLLGLRTLLAGNADIVRERGVYATSQPTLLHFVTGMPLEGQKVPAASGELAEILINAGADLEAPARPGETSETPLVWAVNRNASDVLEELLKAGAAVDVFDYSDRFWTPLTDAVYFGEESMQERLVEAGAQVTLRLAAGMGDLHRVTKFFNENGEISSEAEFPARNADRQQVLDEGLLFAARKGKGEVVRLLLSIGANINARRDVFGSEVTALHEAVSGDCPDIFRLLLSLGADATIKDSLHHSTPFEWAEYQEKPEACSLLRVA